MDLLESALNEQLIEDAVIAQSEAQRQSLWALRDDVAQTFRHGRCFSLMSVCGCPTWRPT